ncbi:hypothetical protein NLG97_g8099 [Lecanicillium saksenae]|uniref:Uncharacterized protein n=1 Tax=Lecanicillium saksenae TaxID=468837 RepID=A0ACC1QMG6_9HYPO|nr:hypothetical protein NLG97_g8099 [Lecanicillium saksenae]
MLNDLHRTAFGHYPSINHAYTRFRSYGIARWVVDVAILGFAIPIIARNPTHNLLIASAYTIAAAGFCVLVFVPLTRPRSECDQRPAFWVTPALALTQAALIPAAVLLIRCYADKSNRYSRRELSGGTASLEKRIYINTSNISGNLNQRLALAGGCCCIASVIAGIMQLVYVGKMYSQARSTKAMQNGEIEMLE